MARCQLAQVNIARARAPMDSAVMAGFVSRLAEINALAEASDGFVWRLEDEAGDATGIRVFDDPRLLINQSVWRSIEAFTAFVYRSAHVQLIKARADWFEKMDGPQQALWWVRAGHLPSPEEGRDRMQHLIDHGPGATAFSVARPFDPPAEQETGT